MRYYIMLKETPIVTFLETEGSLGSKVEIERYLVEDTNLIPPLLRTTDLDTWLQSRVIPRNRANIRLLLNLLNVPYSAIEIVKRTLGLSLIDCYWIVSEEQYSKRTFKQVNLYENDFDTVIGTVAFTGAMNRKINNYTSPEFSTDGMLPKCWRKTLDGIYLYKGGSEGSANSGMEPYSEFLSSQVLHLLQIDHVPYSLKMYKGKLVSTCPIFTSLKESFIPVWHTGILASTKTAEEQLEALQKHMGIQFISDLFVFDYLVANTDRHYGNFGFILNSDTGEILRPAPIFDNGLSLFPLELKDQYDLGLENSMYARVNAIGVDNYLLAKTVMTNETKRKIRKLVNFKFRQHSSYTLPSWRIEALENFVRGRVLQLLQ